MKEILAILGMIVAFAAVTKAVMKADVAVKEFDAERDGE